MTATEHPAPNIEFGRFRVVPERRELLADGQPVELRGKLFDLLMVLIDARGTLVSKNALMNQVWPGRVVEESNLTVAISALRRALGDADAIRTVSGRGYQFVRDAREIASVDAPTPPSPPTRTNLPAVTSELIGREAALSEVRNLVLEHRLSTLTGAGGIGKTRLAVEVARSLVPKFPNGVWIVELAPLTDPELIPYSVALALSLSPTDVTPERIASLLRARHMLVVFDNCEHVVEAAAQMVSQLVRSCPNVFVMCTSREPLRLDGEWVHQVQPLDVPAEDTLSEHDALGFGAMKLFIARARAAQPLFRVEPSNIARMADVCRRLDGMPLALELAAARAAALGVQGVAVRLKERFRLLTGGSRTALPRHQTLRATFDWSYELLTESERLILCRLGVFPGEFTLDAATAILSETEDGSDGIAEQIALLVQKSLVSVNLTDETVRYRMLETTRAYALEKLVERGELQRYARRHAEYHLAVFKRAWIEWTEGTIGSWSPEYLRLLDDTRAALDWAFSSSGDPIVGAELTVTLAALWIRLSLPSEWARRVRQALRAIASNAQADPRLEMQLQAALGVALLHLGPESDAVCSRALTIAERLGDTEHQLLALSGLYNNACGPHHPHRHTLLLAEQFSRVAEVHRDPTAQVLADFQLAHTHLLLGDQKRSAYHIDSVLSRGILKAFRMSLMTIEINPYSIQAYGLWLRGYPDQSLRAITKTADIAIASGHGATFLIVLTVAVCPLLLLLGELAKTEHYLEMVVDWERKTPFVTAQTLIAHLRAPLQILRGDLDNGVSALRAILRHETEPGTPHIVLGRAHFTNILAQALSQSGQVTEALKVIDEALHESQINDICWFVAEHLRIKGDLLLSTNKPDAPAQAERCYLQALETASQQGALALELRTATSLARLRGIQGRSAQALQHLQSVYDRFTEGFETADLATARALLVSSQLDPAAPK